MSSHFMEGEAPTRGRRIFVGLAVVAVLATLAVAMFPETGIFMPHGHCYLWKPQLVVLHAASDALIGSSYVAIAAVLWALVRKVELPFGPTVLAFGLFIGACGATHLIEVWNVWHSEYWLAGAVKAVTAVASVATALSLVPVWPKVVAVVQNARLAAAQRAQLEVQNGELARLNAEVRELARQTVQATERRADEQLRQLIDDIPDLAWSARADGHIDFYNRRWFDYTGTTGEEMEGWGWEKVHDPAVLPEVVRRWREALASGQPFEMEFPLRGADGRFRWFLTRVRPLHDESGRVTRWVGTNTDVDARRQAAAAMQAAIAARDEFLTVASHELKTPIAGAVLNLSVLQRALPPEARQQVNPRIESLERQMLRLGALADTLLDVSVLQEGQLKLRTREVDAAELVHEVARRLGPLAEQSGSPLRVKVPPAVSARWDAGRVEQVLTNLLSNAIKFGAGRPVELELAVEAGRARVEVRDHGPGIPPEVVERLFQRFERGEASRNYAGLGLGLFISRRLAEVMGGALQVRSAPGAGSTFVLELPLVGGDEAALSSPMG